MDQINASERHDLAIAIVGIAGRFPEARTIAEFWQNLQRGRDSISFFSEEELAAAGIEPTLVSNPRYVPARGIVQDIELFDANFFGYNPREAEVIDPQHRIFLQCAWEALETAGYNPDLFPGRIGVYASTSMSSYLQNLYLSQTTHLAEHSVAVGLGNDKDFLPTRVSYKLNLKGPSLNIQTGCSSSLVATHVACQDLLSYQCDMALAGGVSILVPQMAGYLYEDDGIYAQDGRCRAFSAAASGTVPGNGAGVVVLKRLADAIADGDYIYAVIKGTAVNNDGGIKIGFTAPSIDGQSDVIAEALATAGVSPDTISYVETHGTGTKLGDPIEIAALTQAFRINTDAVQYCAIGSVKTNIGHLDAAAGIAGLIKTVLSLQHRQLPPSLYCDQPHPDIDFKNSPFYVNTSLKEWESGATPRRAGVSAFGIGGTNAHIVLEEAPLQEPSQRSKPWHLLVLSSKTETALEHATKRLVDWLEQQRNSAIADVAYTLQVGRKPFSHRRMLVCQSVEDGIRLLKNPASSQVFTASHDGHTRSMVFMFPGVGEQYPGMAFQLYAAEPSFRKHVDYCAEFLLPLVGADLRQVLYKDAQEADRGAPPPKQHPGSTINLREMLAHDSTHESSQAIDQPRIAHLATFVIEYALARLWMEWGVQPQAMIGYSLGEYVAACLAGVFSIQDALTLLAHRALLIETLPPGAMVAVPLSVADVQPFLDHQVDVAAINAPNLCVVAGSTAAIENLEHQLIQKGIACRRVQTTHPFHSTHMLPITDRLLQQISQLSLNPPRIPFISNTSGTWITPQEATDHAYWARHIAHPVRFADGIGELLQESDRIFLEVGPGQSLRGFVLQQMTAEQAAEQVVVTSMSHRYDQQPDLALLLTTVGQLWLSGVEIAWHRMYKHEQRRRCSLPTYAFEGERYWIEAAPERVAVSREDLVASKAPDMSQWFYLPSWKKSLLPLPVGQAASEQQRTQNWLVFLDEIGIGARIAQHLQQHGQHVVTIDVGETFLAEAPNHYRIDLHQPNSYDDLVRQLHAIEQIPDNVVHLWSVTPYAEISGDAESFERLQGRGFYSLLFLTQSLMKQHVTKAVNVYMVSNSMQHVAGEDMLFPEKATLLGPCKSISQEYPHITCRSIDITLPGAGAVSLETVIDQLLAEVHGASNDLVVAYRGWDRWTQIFEQVAVPAPKSVPAKLKQGSAWLISGGLGSVGFALSHYLARTIRPTLFLTSRSTLPERDQWDVYLQTHAAHDKTCRAINKLRALEAAGATVEVVTADIADTQAMRAVVERLRQTVGGLEGVIHAAGIVEGDSIRPISELTPADCAAQFRPKAYGLYVLEQVLQDIPIKYCFLTSSLSPILGGIGLTAYAAANVFMDAFVHKHNRTQASLWTTVNWEGWQFDKGDQTLDGFGETLARLAISAEEGQAAFERVLSLGSLSQVIISTGDLQARIDQWVKLVSIRAADAPATTEESKRYPRPKLLTAYVAPRNTTEHTLVSMWQELLGIEQIGIHDNFFQLGGHSLLGIQVVSRVRVQFRVELPLRTLFESATIADLAKIIIKIQIEQYRGEDLSVLIAEIEQLSDEEVDEILFQGHQQGD